MRALLTGAAATLAAIAFATTPAQAKDGEGIGFTARPFGNPQFNGQFVSPGQHGDRRHRRSRDRVVVPWGWNEGWALYNNRSFEPDSFNGWWHDRPDRAYPAWVQRNQDCQRLWWSGGGWRC